MSGEFIKRVKKSSTIRFPEAGEGGPEEADGRTLAELRPPKGFDFKRKSEDRKPTQLQKKFAEAGKSPEVEGRGTQEAVAVPGVTPVDPKNQGDPESLSFLDSGDSEAKYLKTIIDNGQRIVHDHAQRKLDNIGIREVPLPLADRLQHHRTCDAAFDAKIDELLRGHFFPKGSLLIPEEDLIAKGDIFVVPKFLKERQAEAEAPIEERLKKFLDKR